MFIGKLDEEFLDSLPDDLGNQIDLFGQRIVMIGNILSVIGISLEAVEVEQVEEIEEIEQGEPITGNLEAGIPMEPSNIGFILALIGASTITIGDLISSGGVALEIQQAALTEKKTAEHNREQELRFRKIEKQISELRSDISTLVSYSEDLRKDLVSLQNYMISRLQ